jgi:hypothetical protein
MDVVHPMRLELPVWDYSTTNEGCLCTHAYVMLALLNRNRGGLSLLLGAHLMATPLAATCSQPLQPGATEHHERVRAYEIAAYVAPCPAPVRPRVGLRH